MTQPNTRMTGLVVQRYLGQSVLLGEPEHALVPMTDFEIGLVRQLLSEVPDQDRIAELAAVLRVAKPGAIRIGVSRIAAPNEYPNADRHVRLTLDATGYMSVNRPDATLAVGAQVHSRATFSSPLAAGRAG